MRNIRRNEAIGRQIEEMVALELPELATLRTQRGRWPFDIETEKALIEVKSCRVKTRGHKNPDGSTYMQTGRFAILEGSHKKLLDEAKERGKAAEYIFVIYDLSNSVKIVAKLRLKHSQVNRILKKGRTYTRERDGLRYTLIRHTLIFQQARW